MLICNGRFMVIGERAEKRYLKDVIKLRRIVYVKQVSLICTSLLEMKGELDAYLMHTRIHIYLGGERESKAVKLVG